MRKHILTAGLASAILVTGCATDPNTGQQTMNKTHRTSSEAGGDEKRAHLKV